MTEATKTSGSPTERKVRLGHRVMLLSEVFPPQHGGSGRWFWELYRRIDRTEVQVLTHQVSGAPDFDRAVDVDIKRAEVQLRETGTFSPRGFLGYRRLIRLVRQSYRQRKFEVLHCGRCITEGWVGWLYRKRYGTPYVCYVHGEDVNLPREGENTGVMSSRQHRWMGRRVLRDATLLIANSNNTRQILVEQWGIPKDRIHVLHPGVDVNRFCHVPRNEASRENLGWGGRKVILTVGRLQKRKGHDHLIQALPSILKATPNILYAVTGHGEELFRLQRLASDLGVDHAVQFLSETSDVELVHCYQQCDLFVLPNRRIGSDIEGFGMVLVEAQACGVPVVAGASGGTSETMQPGRTGELVDCNDIELLGRTITDILANQSKRAAMGAEARTWAKSRFSWDCLVDRACETFREAANLSG